MRCSNGDTELGFRSFYLATSGTTGLGDGDKIGVIGDGATALAAMPPAGQPTGWPASRRASQSAGRPASWPAGRPASRPVGQRPSWLAGQPAGQPASWLAGWQAPST